MLHLSVLLGLILCGIIANMKKKREIHYFMLGFSILIFVWTLSNLLEIYAQNLFSYNGMVFSNLCFTAIGFVSAFVFYLGMSFSGRMKRAYYWLLVIPILSSIVLWTNDFHHLFFIHYSRVSSEIIRGPIAYVQAIFAYILIVWGLIVLITFSVKNSGFFSRQSVLMVLGAVLPITVDVIIIFNLFQMSIYYEPISFMFMEMFVMLAIFKFDFLNVMPIALQTVVDHISDSYIVVDEELKVIDFNQTLTDNFGEKAPPEAKDEPERLAGKTGGSDGGIPG